MGGACAVLSFHTFFCYFQIISSSAWPAGPFFLCRQKEGKERPGLCPGPGRPKASVAKKRTLSRRPVRLGWGATWRHDRCLPWWLDARLGGWLRGGRGLAVAKVGSCARSLLEVGLIGCLRRIGSSLRGERPSADSSTIFDGPPPLSGEALAWAVSPT